MIETTAATFYDELETMTEGSTAENDFVGDMMEENYDDQRTRIYIQNLNGLNWDKDGGKWPYICEMIDSNKIDVACFTELNTDTNRYNIRRKMETITQQYFSQNCLVMTASKFETVTHYKPGGTAILACESITANIKSHTRDRMGRWTSICFTTAENRKIRIISAYQVCHNRRPGPNTAAAHQMAQIIQESTIENNSTRPTPRQAFISDLQAFILHCQSEREDIILAGDFNEELNEPTSGMGGVATRCGLADLFSTRTGNSNTPSTYQRGTKRIDYVLMSPSLLDKVIAAGYDPFGYRLPSDHRGMYIDIDTHALFGQDPVQLAPMQKRDFNTTNPETVRQYVMHKSAYLHDHRVLDRLTVLENMVQPDHDYAEALDRDIQRASFHAARKCSRRRSTPWSPSLAAAWAELHYYRIAHASITTQANYEPSLHRIREKWPDLPREYPNSIPEIKQRQRNAIQKLKDIQQRAQAIRNEHLQHKVEMYKTMGTTGKAKIVQRLIRAENQKKVYSKIRYLRNQDDIITGLSKLKIPRHASITDTDTLKNLPDSPDHWETISIPSEIERLLLERNQAHFGQAEGTPLTRPPFTADIGYKADGYAADLILNGQTDYRTINAATQLLVTHLQSRTTALLDGNVTNEDVLGKLKNWKESTTTSPSGIHLGHYHCIWKDTKIPADDPKHEEMKDNQALLLRTTTAILNYAIKFGYAYERWRTVVNVMLQKDPGNPRIHRLRVIHLYEADYNLLLATKWRHAMHHAEKNNLLNDGLYGSRPGRSAHDPALIEVLQHETYRMSMKTGINFDLDATSCYDRILTSVASLSSRRLGMHKNVLQVNTSMLEQAKYHLKTNLGISKGYYSHSAAHPIHGTGQGSGNSPSIWCFVCSSLFDAFATAAHGAKFTTYDGTMTTPIYMIGFVDDCTQRVNDFNNARQPDQDELITTMTTDAQLWNDLLWASGGALEQSKCSFHLIQSDWNNDGHPFLTGGTNGKPIYLTHQGLRTSIYQKSNYTAHKTLGCYINPAYTHIQTWKVMQQKNDKFAMLLETNFFSRVEAWTLYTAFYLPSMTYPLPITPLSKQQCEQLDTRWFRTLLPRCGYNRNMPRAVRYALPSHGGAGFKELYVEQGILLLQQVYKFLNSPTTTVGQMLITTISWTQAFLGTSKLFLTDVRGPIPPVGPSLLLDLRRFLQATHGSLQLHDPPISKMLRRDDRFIMDIALNQTLWKPRHLQQINACRRFLQAQTLADITNMQGTRIQVHAITGTVGPPPTTIRVGIFNQPLPGPQAWKTWRKFLATICNRQAVLVRPLHEWIVPATATRHWPAAVYDEEKDQLYTHYQNTTYYIHSRITTGVFSTRPTLRTTDVQGYPTATNIIMGTLRPVRNYRVVHQPTTIRSIVTIMTSHHHVDQWEYELLRHNEEMTDATTIREHIRNGNIVSCSDGSVRDDTGSFGFIISTTGGQRLAKGSGPSPGAHPNSFRSEAYGVLATMKWLQRAIVTEPPPADTTITHYLDNQSVIQCLDRMTWLSWRAPNQRLQPEQDVLDEIQTIVRAMPIQIEFKWVKGHQDSGASYHLLSLPAQLNCDADQEANSYHEHHNQNHHQQQQLVTPLPSTPTQLIIQNQSVTKHLKHRVRQAITLPRLQLYLRQKFNWDDTTFHSIDWKSYEQIIKKYTESRTTIVKHLHLLSPTGHIAHRNDPNLPHECPACSAPFEDNNHIITCPHPTRSVWRDITTQKILQYRNDESDPHLLDILRDGISRYHRNLPHINPQQYPMKYRILIEQQNRIGWDHLYRGRWNQEWSLLQAEYARRQESNIPMTSTQWILGIGRLLIDQWLVVWKLRNEQRHGVDQARHSRIREHALRNELQKLYTFKSQVCPADHHIFHASAETHINQSKNLDQIENWIAVHREAILASSAMAKRLGIRQNRTIREFPAFNPIAPAREPPSISAGGLPS